jgi:hypothetical protein
MKEIELQDLLFEMLPPDKIARLADELGVVERESKILITQFVISMILSARSPAGARQADAFRNYVETTRQHTLHRGAYYARFTGGLEQLLESLLSDALDAADSVPLLLPKAIATVKDWLIVDSTTVKLDKALKDLYPGTGDYAALKVHKTYSIGRGNLVNYHLWAAREHDALHCVLTEEMRGYGLLVDLGYVSHSFLKECRDLGIEYVIRLKTGWKVKVSSVVEGEAAAGAFDEGPFDLAEALAGKKLRFREGRLDLDVTLTVDGQPFPLRLVALEIPGKGVCAFLTSLSRRRYSADLVGTLYRLRWEIEKDNKVNKSDFCLNALDGRKKASVHAMLYASLLGTILVNRIVHADHRTLKALWKKAPRGPLHVRLVALALGTASFALAGALARNDRTSDAWDGAVAVINGTGRDPNWRSRPSVLDTLHGFTVSPGRARKQRLAAIQHHEGIGAN